MAFERIRGGYADEIAATVRESLAAAIAINAGNINLIGQNHLLDPARIANAAVPTISQGGSYFFNDGISDQLFIGDHTWQINYFG